MSKKRKTRKDKQLADIRRAHSKDSETISSSENKPTFSYVTISENSKNPVVTPSHALSSIPVPSHAYVIQDVRKTLLITGILIIFNALVYVVIQNNLAHLHFLGL